MKKKLTFEHAMRSISGDTNSKNKIKQLYHACDFEKHFFYIPRQLYNELTYDEKIKLFKDSINQLKKHTKPVITKKQIIEDSLRTVVFIVGSVEIAKATGLKQTDISSWLNGKRKWSYDKILDVSHKLGF